MNDVFLSYAPADESLAGALAAAFDARRLSVWHARSIAAGSDFAAVVEREVAEARVVVLVWSAAAQASHWVREEAEFARRHGKLVVARIDDAPLPPGWSALQVLDLRGWRGEPDDPRLGDLLASFERSGAVGAALSRPAAAPRSSAPGIATAARTPTARRGAGLAGAIAGSVGAIVGGLVGLWKRTPAPDRGPPPRAELPQSPTMAEPTGATAGAQPPGDVDPSAAAAPVEAAPIATAVRLAATAPRRCTAGAPFTAALVAYVDAARTTALQHLADLGEPDDRRINDVAASSWLVGAPVTVRLAAEGATVTPAEIRFAWSGHENLAAFAVTIDAATRRDAVVLGFVVFVAEVAVAHLPMRVAVGPAPDTTPEHARAAVPRSAFASYSSRDADIVAQRLSTLARWSPGIDIFQDCLDLRPGEDFKPQLASQIAAREVFLLFWSRRAAASPWVRWEYTTALERKGVDAILPMPIEDPAIAPPPPELADRHLRDRYLLAGYGLAQVHEQAQRGGMP